MCCVDSGKKLGKSITKGVDPWGPGTLGSPRRAAPSAARETGVDRDPSSTKVDPIGFLVPSKQDLSQIMARPTVAGVVRKDSQGFRLASSGPNKPGEEEKAKLCAACMKMRAVFR